MGERRQPQSPTKYVPVKKTAGSASPIKEEELKGFELLPPREKHTESPPGEHSTNPSEEPNFEATGKRHRWTVHTTHEKLIKPKELTKSVFGNLDNDFIHARSSFTLSSLVNSFSSSKGLPYYTELAFEDREEDHEDPSGNPKVEDVDLEDKFNVLAQIGTPTNTNDVLDYK